MATDSKITEFNFDVEADRRANEKLAQMGITSPDDLGSGRADVGLLARQLETLEPERDQLLMEEVARNADWAAQAGNPIQPQPTTTEPASATQTPSQLDTLQAELEAKKAELEARNKELGRLQNKFGEERRRTAERLARLEAAQGYSAPTHTAYQPSPVHVSYDPRILGDADPNTPLTAAQTAALMQNMAQAFGAQLSARDQQLIEAAKQMRSYDLTPDEEADLFERHGWLTTLDRSAQVRAMGDLVKPLREASTPAAGVPKPKGVDMLELARQKHLTATTFIEPSSRGSAQETQAATGVDTVLAKKIAEYKDAIRKHPGDPGVEFGQYNENKTAERLLIEINRLQQRRRTA